LATCLLALTLGSAALTLTLVALPVLAVVHFGWTLVVSAAVLSVLALVQLPQPALLAWLVTSGRLTDTSAFLLAQLTLAAAAAVLALAPLGTAVPLSLYAPGSAAAGAGAGGGVGGGGAGGEMLALAPDFGIGPRVFVGASAALVLAASVLRSVARSYLAQRDHPATAGTWRRADVLSPVFTALGAALGAVMAAAVTASIEVPWSALGVLNGNPAAVIAAAGADVGPAWLLLATFAPILVASLALLLVSLVAHEKLPSVPVHTIIPHHN
jgi:hypothetical protein